jgi:hypothetical protein
LPVLLEVVAVFRPSVFPLPAWSLLFKMEVRLIAMWVFYVEADFLIASHQNRIAIRVLYDFALTSKEVFDGICGIIELGCRPWGMWGV